MNENGDELDGDGVMDEEQVDSESEDMEDDAILKEKDDSSSPRDNI